MSHLYGSVAGAHHTGTSSVHLGEVVESQDVASLRSQVEELKCLLVVALYADAVCGTRQKRKSCESRP